MSSPDYAATRKRFAYGTLLLLTVVLFNSCSKKDERWLEVDPGYAKYVEAYTTGIISKTSSIRVQLAQDAATTHTLGEPVKENLFDFSPNVKGKTIWVDARTIEFKPDKNLKPDTKYRVDFKLDKVTRVADKYRTLSYNLQTLKPAFIVKQTGLRSEAAKDKMFLSGELETADDEDPVQTEKLLSASGNGKDYAIKWQHSARVHRFTISGINRSSNAGKFLLKWNGSALDIDKKGEEVIEVPAEGDFKVLDVTPMNDGQQYASVQFSAPIENGQDLTGLITISNAQENEADDESPAYTIDGSEVKVFTTMPLEGSFTVTISAGVKSVWGETLASGFTSNVVFANRKPSVKILGKGNILPNAGKLVLPFDAVNLNAVDISIIRIYENNIPQFFQQNGLDGESELRRVAKPVVRKTLRLDDDKALDLRVKQRFTLDIDRFLKAEPGAIYRVTIGFRPNYSLYQKDPGDSTAVVADEPERDNYRSDEYYSEYGGGQDEDDEFWNRYDDYYPFGYSWERRDDPTSKSYYSKEKFASRNIIASNIGLTAKRGNDGSLKVAVSNILTTEPIDDAELIIMNYQNKIIGKGESDNDGFADVKLKEKPFLLIAKRGDERGYLKLDDGSALPLSRFDVSGEEVRNGIKGFVFGERGVWRPGDSLFINCIIEDKSGNLPDDMPIELSLINPQGSLFKSIVQENGPDGFNVFKTATASDAPTGNWTARVKAGGAVFEKRIKIETVMPNRLKINLDFGADAILGAGGVTSGKLNSIWLFGAPAKNLKAKVDATLYTGKTSFSKFPEYQFDDPTTNYSTQEQTVFEGTLDDDGNAPVTPNFQTDGRAPGMLTANLTTRVFEPGGAFSIDNYSLKYSPYASYAGMKMPEGQAPFDYLLTGKNHTLQIVNVNPQGQLLGGSRQVEVQFYKIQWRWWWDEGGNSLSNFTQDKYNKLIKTSNVALVNGKGSYNFRVGENDWGRYLILVKDLQSGHMTGEAFYIDEPGWQSRSGNDDQNAAAMLSFSSSKEKYNVGDEVVLTIPSSQGGRVIVSLENGSRVIKAFAQKTDQGQTLVKFKADADMSPNIYATVSLLQPHSQTINDLPIRMYGSVPIIVEDKNTVITPQISMPATVRPESDVAIQVSEKNGRAMTYCIAVVDDGLLDLTRFKTPDPHNTFYAREALGVKSFDLFDEVIGAWGGDLERLLTIGGDEDGGPAKKKSANRFPPVVKYFGPFTLSSGRTQTQRFKMPNYIGSVRTMVIAAHDGAYGKAEKTVTVKKPLMVLSTLPRMLAPGEVIKMPVTVFAMENNIRNVSVTLQSNAFFESVGPAAQTISFSKPGEQLVYFDVRVRNATGIGKIKVSASSGGEKATSETELDVRNPNPVITQTQQIALSPGQKWDVAVSPVGIASAGTAVMEISTLPAMNLQKRLEYLINYPHGCVEQTTSAGFPQLYLKSLTDLSDYQKASADRNVKKAIARLINMQRPEGGFGYWPGASESDDWGSSYAGHFIVEAQANGYTISESMISSWKAFQRSKANGWAPSTTNFYGGDLAQAYRLYTLALAKAPELGAMNRLKEFKYLSVEAKWRLAAAYELAGLHNNALDLTSGLPTTFPERDYWGFTYGSALRDEAMVLEALTLMGQRARAATMLNVVAGRLGDESWYSTQTTSYSLLAIAKYCGKNASGAKILAAANLAGSAQNINSTKYLQQLPIKLKDGSNAVSVTNRGNNMLYVKVIAQGQPLAGDTSLRAGSSGGLNMIVNYMTKDGLPVSIESLSQNTDFIAHVSVYNSSSRSYSQMALTQVFPSGWEILNPRMTDGESAYKSSPVTYMDIRDDRVYRYFNIGKGETLNYYIYLNAAYPGSYYLAPVDCRAMYDNSVSAVSAGKRVQVR